MLTRIVGAKRMTRQQVQAYVRERVGKGMASAAAFLTGRLRATVGVQAPRVRNTAGKWRATVRAAAGAPPRRVSGFGQKSVKWRRTPAGVTFTAVWYLRYWESHGHPWLAKTLKRYAPEAKRIAFGKRGK